MHDQLETAWLALGVVAGLVVGLNVAGLWPQVPLHAVATHGQDTFAICTVPLDEDIEAVFILDDLTGDLKGAALNVQMRSFNTFFEYNVHPRPADGQRKNPHYRIVSGTRQHAAERQAGQCGPLGDVCGRSRAAASSWRMRVPWIPGRATGRHARASGDLPIDRWQFRTTPIRDP